MKILLLSSLSLCAAFAPLRTSTSVARHFKNQNGSSVIPTNVKSRTMPTLLHSTESNDGEAEVFIEGTPLSRYRRRKRSILSRRKMINTSYLFALWYIFSIAYNIFSKKSLTLAPELAWTSALLQMGLGLTYVLPLWKSGIREKPKLAPSDFVRLLPVAILHSLVHIGGVVSMGAGAVSFTYIVKASEPAVSAVLSALTGTVLPPTVYLTLLPVMSGVAIASVSELSFTWKSFNYAMISNLASAGRGLVGKKTINKRLGQSMTPSNLYAVLTIMATLLLIPVALIMEGSVLSASISNLRAANQLMPYLGQTFLASLSYYLYNELAFLCLDNVSPISHALGNTLKRVFIIVSSMLVFGNRMNMRGCLGSILAVGGVLMYSMEKTRLAKKAKQN